MGKWSAVPTLLRSLLVGLVGVVGFAGPTSPSAQAAPVVACTGSPDIANRLDLTVNGTPTYGLYVVPAGRPKGLVVVDHGYSHTPYSWVRHLSDMARRDGVIAVAMDYRGTLDSPPATPGGLPSSRGWQVQEGAEDSIAVARLFDTQCPRLPTIELYSVSMGGNTAGLAAAAKAQRLNGRPLWDYWIDVEGAVNVTETYNEATLVALSGNTFAKNAKEDIEREMGGVDFLVHGAAYAPAAELSNPFLQTSREGFRIALDVSAYSLIALARASVPMMEPRGGGSILTLTYLGSERVFPNYNVMGVAKAALESSVRYLAGELGTKNIRVNAISAGPIKTLAASGIGDFRYILKWNEHNAPLRRSVTTEEVGDTAVYFLSDLSRAVTGEIHHVDAGYHIVGMKHPDAPDIVVGKE